MGIWYQRAEEAKAYIVGKISASGKTFERPDFALVLGTCFGSVANTLSDKIEIPYQEIPHFTHSTVSGHAGKLIYCSVGGKKGFIMQGRTHAYEGYETAAVILPIRVFALMGTSVVVLTNAAGGLNPSYRVGDFVIITDQMAFFAQSPLIGENEEKFGTRFPSMDDAYDPALCRTAEECAKNCGIAIHKGVYAYMKGPQFETPAEIRALRILGADLVGMSTVLETIGARHCGMRVLGISCVTNLAAGISDTPISHESVSEIEKQLVPTFAPFMKALIARL